MASACRRSGQCAARPGAHHEGLRSLRPILLLTRRLLLAPGVGDLPGRLHGGAGGLEGLVGRPVLTAAPGERGERQGFTPALITAIWAGLRRLWGTSSAELEPVSLLGLKHGHWALPAPIHTANCRLQERGSFWSAMQVLPEQRLVHGPPQSLPPLPARSSQKQQQQLRGARKGQRHHHRSAAAPSAAGTPDAAAAVHEEQLLLEGAESFTADAALAGDAGAEVGVARAAPPALPLCWMRALGSLAAGPPPPSLPRPALCGAGACIRGAAASAARPLDRPRPPLWSARRATGRGRRQRVGVGCSGAAGGAPGAHHGARGPAGCAQAAGEMHTSVPCCPPPLRSFPVQLRALRFSSLLRPTNPAPLLAPRPARRSLSASAAGR